MWEKLVWMAMGAALLVVLGALADVMEERRRRRFYDDYLSEIEREG